MVSGQQDTAPTSLRPRALACAIASSSLNTAFGLVLLCSRAAMITGRPERAESSSRKSIFVWPPLVSMNTPLPDSLSVPTRVRSSSSSASREGMGMPPSPLCAGEVLVANPIAPACMASCRRRFISCTSAGVATRLGASSPITQVRNDEWPAKAAMFTAVPCRSSIAMYCGMLSKSQRMPWRSTSSDMPSTWVRLRMMSSRSAGRHGAMVKPQLPMMAVVTPSAGDGLKALSQVICAS
jgi:hypothetical protein